MPPVLRMGCAMVLPHGVAQKPTSPHFQLFAPFTTTPLTASSMVNEPLIQLSSRDISLGSLCRLSDQLLINGVLMHLPAKVRHLAEPCQQANGQHAIQQLNPCRSLLLGSLLPCSHVDLSSRLLTQRYPLAPSLLCKAWSPGCKACVPRHLAPDLPLSYP